MLRRDTRHHDAPLAFRPLQRPGLSARRFISHGTALSAPCSQQLRYSSLGPFETSFHAVTAVFDDASSKGRRTAIGISILCLDLA